MSHGPHGFMAFKPWSAVKGARGPPIRKGLQPAGDRFVAAPWPSRRPAVQPSGTVPTPAHGTPSTAMRTEDTLIAMEWQLPSHSTNAAAKPLVQDSTPAPAPMVPLSGTHSPSPCGVWEKPVTVPQFLAISRHPQAWSAVLQQGAEHFMNHFATAHEGLLGFEGVTQCPSPRGHCVPLSRPHCETHAALSRRLGELLGGILEMLVIHKDELSPAARASSVTYVTLPILVDRESCNELVAEFFLDGLLPRPECGGKCPTDWMLSHHDEAAHGAALLPAGGGREGRHHHTYNAWLSLRLNEEWHKLSALPTFELGDMVTLLIRFGLAAAMGYTRPAVWSRVWGGPWGGNIHATRWLAKSVSRALNCDVASRELLTPNFAGYGDGPSLSVQTKVNFAVRDNPGTMSQQLVIAAQLQVWLKESAKKDPDPLSRGEWVWCRAQLRVVTMPAWQRVLSALHPHTIIVADHTSWWCHAQWGVCFNDAAIAQNKCGVRDAVRDIKAPSGWQNPLRAQAPTMLLSLRETRGKERSNCGEALALVTCHAVDVRPSWRKGGDALAVERPVLAMHMLNGKPGAEGHMVACKEVDWHEGPASIRAAITRSMHAMGKPWGALGGAAWVSAMAGDIRVDATLCVKRKHQVHVIGMQTATLAKVQAQVQARVSLPTIRKGKGKGDGTHKVASMRTRVTPTRVPGMAHRTRRVSGASGVARKLDL